MDDGLEHLASYVPPPVLRRLACEPNSGGAPSPDHFGGVVLLADVSGFSRLAEELAEKGSSGAEELSRILNETFGRLIEHVHGCGGEVLDFAGDATIALFRGGEGEPLTGALARAAHAALLLQAELHRHRERAAGALTCTVGIAAGTLWFADLEGAEGGRRFLLGGDPIAQVSAAAHYAAPGEIVLTPSAAVLLEGLGRGRPLAGGHVLLEALRDEPELEPVAAPRLPATAAASLRRYVSPAVLAALDAGQPGWLAELRRVTVWFLNLPVGPGEPEQVRARLQTVLQAGSVAVARYQGAINQFVIDDKGITLLAAWGLPSRTHEDDAARALEGAAAAGQELAAAGIEARIGVATGRAFCGDRGSARRREYALIGSTVNLAARLAQAAGRGVVCDEASRLAAAAQSADAPLRFQAIPAVALDERSDPVVAHRVRLATGERLPPLLFGREGERAALRDRLEALVEGPLEPDRRLVFVEGEPGIGKSRLLAGLVDTARSAGVRVFRGEASSIERATPYRSWRTPVASLLGMADAPIAPEKRGAWAIERLSALDPELAEQAPLLNGLLSLDLPETSLTAQMQGEARAASLQRLVCRLLAGETALLVLEDAHWFDSASWSLLRRVAQELPRLLLVVSTRPLVDPVPDEYAALQASGCDLVRPSRLSRDETERLLCDRLGVAQVAVDVLDFVDQRAEGNPFFCEELATALRDEGHVQVRDGACRFASEPGELTLLIPDSVQATIAARVDRLPPAAQLTLKVASVIGPVFSLALLRDVHPVKSDEAEIDKQLDGLERVDLVARRSGDPSAFRFRHAITQQVAYEQLTFTQRRALHQRVAEWHEAEYGSRLAPYLTLLAHHWGRAGAADRAIPYMDAAASQALESDANLEAIRWFEAARSADPPSDDADEASSLRWAEREQRLGDAYYRHGRLAESDHHARTALACLRGAVPAEGERLVPGMLARAVDQLARRVGLRRARARDDAERRRAVVEHGAHLRLSVIAVINSNTRLAFYSTLHSLEAAERLGPSPERAHAYSTFTAGAGLIPLHTLARSYRRRALRTLSALGSTDTHARARVLAMLAFQASGSGDWEVAYAELGEARELLARFGDWTEWGLATQQLARSAAHRARYDELVRLSQELLDSARTRGVLVEEAWAHNNLAEAAIQQDGAADAARASLDRALEIGAQTRNVTADTTALALRATLEERLGRWQDAYASARRALDGILEQQETSYGTIVAHHATTRVLLACWERGGPEAERAAADMVLACRALRRMARIFPVAEPAATRALAGSHWLRGQRGRARRLWRRSLRRAEELGMVHDAGWALLELGRHAERGSEEGRQQLERAAEVFEQLRAGYDLAWARTLLDEGSG